uniref:bifunctional diaminohydroxyphosphoribosylaminopyrimidine deaminase/5-amino-6-(5-phosphoribosylamino)uracil reductase RibD n=1 Tax=Eubacterium cellulosolvens TaxID=29322 RepID=UPI0004820AAF|nr:bifunctional diaminohydroxyphosphoribosylaminopyrimidine deaminase/5-amino-6-(5-phosphoribosylamino)uracil reductase RibD [[Eubacterium] cellulosolvens]
MTDEEYMRRAIALARKGEGWCHPNPMVGAVIVRDGEIIGEGYHAKCGELHAERNAFRSLRCSAEGAVLYVTLEPCCHVGRTPPCTEAIIENRIAKVIIGSRDPNPKVHGKGAEILRRAGIEVVEDFLREECDALNDVFFHYITTGRPYVKLKYAMTADGKIATRTGASKWITAEAAREEVQRMRHACMGIMVGSGTVKKDDPMLNCRLPGGRDPVRIICDSRLSISRDSQIVRSADRQKTIIVGACREADADFEERRGTLENAGASVWNLPSRQGNGVDLSLLMQKLGEAEIDSVLLEGGGILADSALREGIVSEVDVFTAPKIFGGRGKSPVEGEGVDLPSEAVMLTPKEVKMFGEDLFVRYEVRKREVDTCSPE